MSGFALSPLLLSDEMMPLRTIPEENTILNSLVYAVNILHYEYLRNSFKIRSDEQALLTVLPTKSDCDVMFVYSCWVKH